MAVLDLATTWTDGVTEWTGDTARRVVKVLGGQAFAALEALKGLAGDTGIIEGFEVTEDSGLNVSISAGLAIVQHSTKGIMAVKTTAPATLALTDNATNYIFALAEISTNDSRETMLPSFVTQAGTSNVNGERIATVVTSSGGIDSIADDRTMVSGLGGGSTIFVDSGAPDNGDGANGDLYINSDNGALYQKSAGAWALQGNLTGPQGTPGGVLSPQGDWTTATAYAALDSVRNDGASYFCYVGHTSGALSEPGTGANWEDYWALFAEDGADGAAGSNGTNGTNGATWTSGSGAPSGGSNGDLYFRTSNSDVYQKSAGTWSVIANIKGATGLTGATGATGATGDTGLSYGGTSNSTIATGLGNRTFTMDDPLTLAYVPGLRVRAADLSDPTDFWVEGPIVSFNTGTGAMVVDVQSYKGDVTGLNDWLFGIAGEPASVMAPTIVTLTDASTIAVDATLGNRFRVTLGASRTLGNPTGALDGQPLLFEIKQDATGSRLLTLDTKYRFGTDITSITLTTTANKKDFLAVIYDAGADKFDVVDFVKGF